ncbi:MAG: hypothetical protein EBU43_06775 [Actinobacteria bacterium]|nr:hypothetical protein [Actinomycetota bacterium]
MNSMESISPSFLVAATNSCAVEMMNTQPSFRVLSGTLPPEYSLGNKYPGNKPRWKWVFP